MAYGRHTTLGESEVCAPLPCLHSQANRSTDTRNVTALNVAKYFLEIGTAVLQALPLLQAQGLIKPHHPLLQHPAINNEDFRRYAVGQARYSMSLMEQFKLLETPMLGPVITQASPLGNISSALIGQDQRHSLRSAAVITYAATTAAAYTQAAAVDLSAGSFFLLVSPLERDLLLTCRRHGTTQQALVAADSVAARGGSRGEQRSSAASGQGAAEVDGNAAADPTGGEGNGSSAAGAAGDSGQPAATAGHADAAAAGPEGRTAATGSGEAEAAAAADAGRAGAAAAGAAAGSRTAAGPGTAAEQQSQPSPPAGAVGRVQVEAGQHAQNVSTSYALRVMQVTVPLLLGCNMSVTLHLHAAADNSFLCSTMRQCNSTFMPTRQPCISAQIHSPPVTG